MNYEKDYEVVYVVRLKHTTRMTRDYYVASTETNRRPFDAVLLVPDSQKAERFNSEDEAEKWLKAHGLRDSFTVIQCLLREGDYFS